MKPGDRVDIYYPGGILETGEIADFDAHTAVVGLAVSPEWRAIIVAVGRLKAEAPARWRLDLQGFPNLQGFPIRGPA